MAGEVMHVLTLGLITLVVLQIIGLRRELSRIVHILCLLRDWNARHDRRDTERGQVVDELVRKLERRNQ